MHYRFHLSCFVAIFAALILFVSFAQASDSSIQKNLDLNENQGQSASLVEIIADAEVELPDVEPHTSALVRSPGYKIPKEEDKINIEIEEITDPKGSTGSDQSQPTVTQAASEDNSRARARSNASVATQASESSVPLRKNKKNKKAKASSEAKKSKSKGGMFFCFGGSAKG